MFRCIISVWAPGQSIAGEHHYTEHERFTVIVEKPEEFVNALNEYVSDVCYWKLEDKYPAPGHE